MSPSLRSAVGSEIWPSGPPLFIVGTQRSGTTLVYQMLNTHPHIYLVNEFWHLYPHLTGEIRDLQRLERLLVTHLHLDQTYLDARAPKPADPFAHVDLAFAAKLRSLSKRRWGIKHPRLTYYLDLFHLRYLDAQFVFVVRDPRAVVSSFLSRKMNVANAYHGARLWVEQVGIHADFVSRHPQHCHTLLYEELLARPVAVLAEVCAFLQVEYLPHLLRYHESEPDTTIHNGNVNITRPLQPEFAEKWRSRLSPRQVALVEGVAGARMSELGYRRSGHRELRVSALQRLALDLHQRLMTTYWWQRRSGWSGVRRRVNRLLGRRQTGAGEDVAG